MDKRLLKVCCLIFTAFLFGGCNMLSYFPTTTPTIMPPTQTNTTTNPVTTSTQLPTATQTPSLTWMPTPVVVENIPAGIPQATKLCDPLDGWTNTEEWIGGTQWMRQIFFTYHGGTVLFSSSADGSQPIHLDDVVQLTIPHPNKTIETFYYEMVDPDCSGGIACEAGPFDLTEYFYPGQNTVKIEIIDLYPEAWGVSSLYLVEFSKN